MKNKHISRRDFFKLGAFGGGAAALAAVVGLPTLTAQASADVTAPAAPSAGGPFYVPPAFNAIPSTLNAGAPTDISMGWDGTLWAIDAHGEPHQFDHVRQTWASFGSGIDAAAAIGGLVFFFRGDKVIGIDPTNTSQPSVSVPIDSQWSVPDAFKLGVNGAVNYNNQSLLLFKGGRFVSTDGAIPVTSLTSLPGWPQTPNECMETFKS